MRHQTSRLRLRLLVFVWFWCELCVQRLHVGSGISSCLMLQRSSPPLYPSSPCGPPRPFPLTEAQVSTETPHLWSSEDWKDMKDFTARRSRALLLHLLSTPPFFFKSPEKHLAECFALIGSFCFRLRPRPLPLPLDLPDDWALAEPAENWC